MTQSNIKEFEFETTSCYVAYDAENGKVLYIHECMKEKGSYKGESDPDEDTVLQMAQEDYGDCNLKVMKLPEGFEMKPESTYRVDIGSGELQESAVKTMTFREFRKQTE